MLTDREYHLSKEQLRYLKVKRILDLFFSAAGLLFLCLLYIFIKIASLITHDFAPIIYRQVRVGLNGKEFVLYKFRTMVPAADEKLSELLDQKIYKEEWDEKQKISDDPRITSVGKILRITSLDELPQLINVLKGEMSLVGPRPLVPGELERHGGKIMYQIIMPGLTGWWGCNGRSNLTYAERLELEYYYIENVSMALDVKCIIKTIISVMKNEGAK